MGWFENFTQSVSNPDNAIKNVATLGAYSLYDATVPGFQSQKDDTGYGGTAGSAAERQKDLEAGYKKGHELFYDDPDMKALREKREDLAKGYDSKELGSLREGSRSELEGQRVNTLNTQRSNLARSGVGGARAAAMTAETNTNFAGKRQQNENTINGQQAGMVRQGTNDLQDFYFRQKEGELGTGAGYAQLGVADRGAAAQAAIANKEPKKGLFGRLTDGFF